MKSPKYSSDWFSEAENVFKKALTGLAGKENLNFLEIGTWEGRSAIWFLDNILTHKTSKISCVDDFGGINNVNNAKIVVDGLRDRLNENLKPYRGKYTVYDGNSRDVLKYLISKGEEYDCVYVDGGHDAYNCLFDGVFSFEMLKVGGYLIFDDYMWNWDRLPSHLTPKVAIDSIMECLRGRIKVIGVGWKTVVIKKSK